MNKFSNEGIKQGVKYFIQVFVIYILTSLLAYVFDMYSVHSENLLILYLLGVLIIIMETKNFLITTLSSVLFLVTHNFLFLEPRYTWVFYSRNFALSATVFFVVALIVNTLVVRLQKQITAAKKNEQLHKKLYEASQGLLKVHGKERIVTYSDEALTKLAGAEVEFYFDIDKNDSNEARKWCYKHSAKCGHGETEFADAGCKYLPIRSKKKTIGVVSIDCSEKELTEEVEDCIVALLSQITIAIERDALETQNKKEMAEHERERIKATVMKSLSHDMYPRIKAIHENAKQVNENMNLMDDEEIHAKLDAVEAEADYITQVVDNLLDITKE